MHRSGHMRSRPVAPAAPFKGCCAACRTAGRCCVRKMDAVNVRPVHVPEQTGNFRLTSGSSPVNIFGKAEPPGPLMRQHCGAMRKVHPKVRRQQTWSVNFLSPRPPPLRSGRRHSRRHPLPLGGAHIITGTVGVGGARGRAFTTAPTVTAAGVGSRPLGGLACAGCADGFFSAGGRPGAAPDRKVRGLEYSLNFVFALTAGCGNADRTSSRHVRSHMIAPGSGFLRGCACRGRRAHRRGGNGT